MRREAVTKQLVTLTCPFAIHTRKGAGSLFSTPVVPQASPSLPNTARSGKYARQGQNRKTDNNRWEGSDTHGAKAPERRHAAESPAA